MSLPNLSDIDAELAAFGVSDERITAVRATARQLRSELGASLTDLDGALEALGAGLPSTSEAPVHMEARIESVAPPGTIARPTSWDEARPSERPEDEAGSGLLDLSDEALRSQEVPPVLAVEAREPLSQRTALYIDPPTNPPPAVEERAAEADASDALSLDLDPEAGLVEPALSPSVSTPSAPPVRAARPATQPPPRPSAIPPKSTDDLLAEVLDAPIDESLDQPAPIEAVSPPPAVVDPSTLSVSENETGDVLAAMQATELGVGTADFDDEAPFQEPSTFGEPESFGELDDVQPERTVMMRADALHALLPPSAHTETAGSEDADGVDFELDIDEEVMMIDEDEAPPAAASNRSRPPPPPSRPPEGSKSRPPEPPGKGFLSRLLKGTKPS